MSNDVIVKVNNFITYGEIKVLRQYCEGTEVDWNVGGQPADTIWYNRVVQSAQLPKQARYEGYYILLQQEHGGK